MALSKFHVIFSYIFLPLWFALSGTHLGSSFLFKGQSGGAFIVKPCTIAGDGTETF